MGRGGHLRLVRVAVFLACNTHMRCPRACTLYLTQSPTRVMHPSTGPATLPTHMSHLQATSAVDTATESRLYALLAGRVSSHVSVGHRLRLVTGCDTTLLYESLLHSLFPAAHPITLIVQVGHRLQLVRHHTHVLAHAGPEAGGAWSLHTAEEYQALSLSLAAAYHQ